MGKVIEWVFSNDTDGKKYGNLRRMITHSKAGIGSLLSSSFDERCHWAGNFIMHKDNLSLKPTKLEKLVIYVVILRMSKKWLEHMRKHHSEEVSTKFRELMAIPKDKNV